MNFIRSFLLSALLAPLPGAGWIHAAEFEVLDKLSVDGYSVFRGSADILGGGFAVGGSTFVVKEGKVGIGTDSPGSLLNLYSAGANPTLKITDASGAGTRGALLSGSWGGNGAYLDSLASAGWVYLGSSPGGGQANQVVAYTAGAERLRIASSGSVGIGTTGPGAPLEVSGTSNRNAALMIVSSTGAYNGDGSDTTEKGLTIAASAVAVHGLLFNVKVGDRTMFSVGGNGSVGIGAAGAGANLHVSSTTASAAQDMLKVTTGTANADVFVIKGSGKVGIGTTNPAVTLDLAGTDAIKIPVGTTAERPSSPANGMLRINTTTGKLEYFYNSGWNSIGAVTATGGTITENGGYRIHTYTSGGTFTVVTGGNVEVLVVAGGGGGGGASDTASGGGGAGGFRTATLAVTAGAVITVTVGAGGAKSTAGAGRPGNNGLDSVFDSVTAAGGGGGGSYPATVAGHVYGGAAGGSGGGGSYGGIGGAGTQGFAGGSGNTGSAQPGGGGGGAGGAGGDATATVGGNGGSGGSSSISGAAVTYAGGGGGGSYNSSSPGSGGSGGGGSGAHNADGADAAANTGGGGGGTGSNPATSRSGGAGGSGIVIIRYPN